MASSEEKRITCVDVVDSHTGGEPTRVVLSGGPDLGNGSLRERRQRFSSQYDDFRAALVNEPRGTNALVGALLCRPVDPTCTSGIIFFNNVGTIGMCGHGTIGVAVTLAYLNRIDPGKHRFETPVGTIAIVLHEDRHHVTVENVASFRHLQDVSVAVPGYETVVGDVAWGGNWFFLVNRPVTDIDASRIEQLTRFTLAIRDGIRRDAVTGAEGAMIDHIELFGPAEGADSRNFVLCPGGAWDRSPCGTGTSAKLACLAADGRLMPGEVWRQQSAMGTHFDATYRYVRDADGKNHDDTVIPSITGSAWITAESKIILDDRDPFSRGIGR